MHEQSETVQRPDGKWINVYGRKTPKAGEPLPGMPAYDSVDAAVAAAKKRSEEEGKREREREQQEERRRQRRSLIHVPPQRSLEEYANGR